MRKCKAECIGAILRQFMREEGLEQPYNQYKIKASLGDVLGEGIFRFVVDSFIKDQALCVKLNSPLLCQELNMKRQQLVSQLNKAVGAMVITDIRFFC